MASEAEPDDQNGGEDGTQSQRPESDRRVLAVRSIPEPAPGCAVRELASGVDAFYLSGYATPSNQLLGELERLQAVAVSERMGQPIEFGGVEFMVQGYGWGQHSFLLTHPYGRIGVTASSQFPAFRVQPLAVTLHGLGAESAVEWFETVIRTEVGDEVDFTARRVDLFCDVQGWVPTPATRALMVCRSRNVVTYEVDGQMTGMEFGRRKTAGVLLRVYDKSLQAFEMGLDYWYPIWGDRFDPTLPVWRVEFEIGRKALRQYGIDHSVDAWPRLPGVWAAITSKLYRLTVESDDQTRSRWSTAAQWAAIQRASLRADAVPVERLIEHKKAGTLRTLQPLLNGVLSTFGALTGCTTIEDVLYELPDYLDEYERWTSVEFADRIEAKKRRG